MLFETIEISAAADRTEVFINGVRMRGIESLQFDYKRGGSPQIILDAPDGVISSPLFTVQSKGKNPNVEQKEINSASYELYRSQKESADYYRRLHYDQCRKSELYKTLLQISAIANAILALIVFFMKG